MLYKKLLRKKRNNSKNGNPISGSMKFSFRKLLPFAVLLIVSFNSYASHFRFGSITATRLSETATTVTYQLNLSESWRLGSSPAAANFIVSGGNSGAFTIPTTNVIDPSGSWLNSTGSYIITLTKTTTLTRIETTGANKITTTVNNANGRWDIYIILNTGAPGNAPVSSLPAVINMPVNQAAATYSVAVSDSDPGAVLTFGTPSFTGALANQTEPSGFSIDALTGLITLNTVGKTIGQLYNALVTITDNDGNQIIMDFIINIVGPSTPPVFDYTVTPPNGTIFNIVSNQNISFPIVATDIDSASLVSLSVSGLSSSITINNFNNNPLPATGNPSQTTFSWTPTQEQIGGSFVLNFIATDNVGVQATTSITIRVQAEPAPVFIGPTPQEGSIRQIVTGNSLSDTIRASSVLNSNVSISSSSGIPANTTYNNAIPTPGANPGETIITWSPVPADFGIYTLSFTASIANSPSIYTVRSYQLIANTVPEFSSTPVTNVLLGQPYSYTITVSDLDIPYGDTIEIVGNTIPAWLTLTSTGNGTAVLSGVPSLGDIGSNAVSIIAEDIYHHGNPAEVKQEFNILVISPAPVAICKNATIVLTASGNATLTADQVDNGSHAIRGILSLAVSPSIFNCSNTGNNTAILTVTDSSGNTSTCTSVVTVLDTLAPRITCSANITVTANSNDCHPVITWANPVATDNCSYTVTSNHASGDRFVVGTTTVVYTVSDPSGNTANCSFDVTVKPNPLVGIISAKTFVGGSNISCYGLNDGEATVSISGGCLPYNYSWNSVPAQNTATATHLAAGVYVVTVTDANAQVISLTVNLSQPPMLIANAGSNATVYYGYGPKSCAQLSGLANGGTVNYTYAWSDGANTQSTTVCPSVTSNYTLTITDANGCKASDEITICSIDVRCEKGGANIIYYEGGKVLVCHVPDGDISKQQTICIAPSAVATHLAHGDKLGICGANSSCNDHAGKTEAIDITVDDVNENIYVTVFPNPFDNTTILEFKVGKSERTIIEIYDLKGSMVSRIFDDTTFEDRVNRVEVNGSKWENGIYIARIVSDKQVQNIKLVLTH